MSKNGDQNDIGALAPAVEGATSAAKPAKRTRQKLVVNPSEVPSVSALAASIPRASVPGPKKAFVSGEPIKFVTEPNSPFADGYSIKGEREALAAALALSEADQLDYGHPDFERVMELDARERQLQRAATDYKQRNGADSTVGLNDARSMQTLGALVASAQSTDTMTLHTKEGLRLFMGRAKDPERKLEAIPGGTRIGSAAKVVWMLTALDNPYADWALLRLEENLRFVTDLLQKETDAGVQKLASMRDRGINYSVLASRAPKTLELGFKSPYGFAIAEVIALYDYFVRVNKSLVHRNLLADDAGLMLIRGVTRTIRGRFNEFARFERTLTRQDCSGLSRADYVLVQGDKDSDDAKAAAARISAITEVLGPVPSEVFAGTVAPKHSKRRQKLTQHDRAVLDAIARHLDQTEHGDPAAVNAAVEADTAAML